MLVVSREDWPTCAVPKRVGTCRLTQIPPSNMSQGPALSPSEFGLAKIVHSPRLDIQTPLEPRQSWDGSGSTVLMSTFSASYL